MPAARQLDFFAPTIQAYASGEPLANEELYRQVAKDTGIDPAMFEERIAVGAAGQRHSLPKGSAGGFNRHSNMS